jgi:Xaa-Pro dipeptidase
MNMLLYRGEKFNANFFHNAGVDIDHSFLFSSTTHGNTLLVSEMNYEYAKSKFKKGKVKFYSKKAIEEIKKLSKKSEPVGLDYPSISAFMFLKLRREFKTEDISEKLNSLRAVKKPAEISTMKKAAALTRKLISNAGNNPAQTDGKTANQFLLSLFKEGVSPAFSPIVASGANSSFPHSIPTPKKMQSPLLFDAGVRLNYFNADITRCFRLSKEQKGVYEKLQSIFHSIQDEVPNLRTGKDLALFTKKCYLKENLPHPPHSIGHGVGLEVHEKPSLSIHSKDLLKGAVFTLEPSVYFPGKFGLRYEDMLYFDGKKARVL